MPNEPQCPLVKPVLELALEPRLARVQVLALELQAAALAQLEPLEQVQLELEQHLQRSHPKPQLHRHRCKAPDRSQEPQLGLLQTQVHPKALDMTPRVLELAQVPELERMQELALAQELEQRAQQELLVQELVQEPEPGFELRVFLERLPLRQG